MKSLLIPHRPPPTEKWKISKRLPAILHNNPFELMSTSTGTHETNTNSRPARVKIAYFAKIRSSRSEFSQNASHSIPVSVKNCRKIFILSNSDFSLSFPMLLHNAMKGLKNFVHVFSSGKGGLESVCVHISNLFNYRLQLATDAPWCIYRHFNFASIFPKAVERAAMVSNVQCKRRPPRLKFKELDASNHWVFALTCSYFYCRQCKPLCGDNQTSGG